MTGNPAAGILVLLAALWLLMAFFAGRLEWLFQLGSTGIAVDQGTPTTGGATVPPRPTTTGGAGAGAGGQTRRTL